MISLVSSVTDANRIVDWSQILTPIAVALITGFIIPLINKSRSYMISKIGTTNYNKAMSVARGLFIKLEQEYGPNEGATKRKKMIEDLHSEFPTLSDTELLSINKDVWAVMTASMDALYNDGSTLSSQSSKENVTKDEVPEGTEPEKSPTPESDSNPEHGESTPTPTTDEISTDEVDDQTGESISDDEIDHDTSDVTLDMPGEDGEAALNDHPAESIEV